MSYENETLTGMISDDFGEYLAHYGVPGMHPRVHTFGKYQNQAVYARGNAKYAREAKAAKKQEYKEAKKAAKEAEKESAAYSRALMKDLRSTNKWSGVKGIAKDVIVKPFKKSSEEANKYQDAKTRYKAAKASGASKEDLEAIKDEKRGAFRNSVGSSLQGIYNAINTATAFGAGGGYIRARLGENAAFRDLGLSNGWGKARRAFNTFDYYTKNPEKCNKKLDSIVQKYRNSKFNRAILGDYDRKIVRAYYQEAYDRVLDNAFANYGMTPSRRLPS